MIIRIMVSVASKYKVYIFLFVVLIVGYIIAAYSITSKTQSIKKTTEHFTDTPSSQNITETKEDDYKARLTVIDVFDAYMKRNPTPSEINKYAVFKNEQDILVQVMKDYPNTNDHGSKVTSEDDVITSEDNDIVEAEESYIEKQSDTIIVKRYEIQKLRDSLQNLAAMLDDKLT